MNKLAIQCLQFIRQSHDDFSRGWALGYMSAMKWHLEPWERQYIEVIANRIFWEKE